MTEPKDKSPNAAIDKAIKAMMEEITVKRGKSGKDGEEAELAPLDMRVKVINTAINWEKVKHSIKDGEEFDPTSI